MFYFVLVDTAYCKSPIAAKWYKFDDQDVSEISKSDIKVSTGIIIRQLMCIFMAFKNVSNSEFVDICMAFISLSNSDIVDAYTAFES